MYCSHKNLYYLNWKFKGLTFNDQQTKGLDLYKSVRILELNVQSTKAQGLADMIKGSEATACCCKPLL